MIIDYNKFLSIRFDLVIRYYFLEKANFNAIEAKKLVLSSRYKFLRLVFKELLIRDIKTKPGIAKKNKLVNIHDYGEYVSQQLFHMPNWNWIEKNMNNDWIKKNPYLVKIDGLGCSVKRFLISLKYGKNLYWEFKKKGKTLLSLWDENLHKELLTSDQFKKIMKSKKNMMNKMAILDFFSDETYVGDKKLYEKYIKNLQT